MAVNLSVSEISTSQAHRTGREFLDKTPIMRHDHQ